MKNICEVVDRQVVTYLERAKELRSPDDSNYGTSHEDVIEIAKMIQAVATAGYTAKR